MEESVWKSGFDVDFSTNQKLMPPSILQVSKVGIENAVSSLTDSREILLQIIPDLEVKNDDLPKTRVSFERLCS